ncbi:uncharacterized protein LOC143236433 [Tachypleus tridentatus]|uniref:uncharacterized protein LOC143236433 n=1 Tax=Tachypleus tridentatus TaxID=6853 RepID=UPI003FD346C6
MSLTKLYPWNNPETSKYSKYLSFLLGVSTLMSLTEAALICHQCTWDNEHEIWENDIMSLKEILKELGGDSVAIDDPFTIPFLGKNLFPQEPTKNDLYRECFNCSTTGGVCVKWSFSVSGSTLNITRLCARSTYKSGCYELSW